MKFLVDIIGVNGDFSGNLTVADQAYGVAWNGSLQVPTKNSVYQKIESVVDKTIIDFNFNSGTGNLSLTYEDLTTITTSIDNRYTLFGHLHEISNVTGLQAALDGKVDNATLSNYVDLTTNQVIDGTKEFSKAVFLNVDNASSSSLFTKLATGNVTSNGAPAGYGGTYFNNDGTFRLQKASSATNLGFNFNAITGVAKDLVFTDSDITWNGTSLLDGSTWGSITGTLSNQTDLQSALNLKANDADVVKLAGNQDITGLKTLKNILDTEQKINFKNATYPQHVMGVQNFLTQDFFFTPSGTNPKVLGYDFVSEKWTIDDFDILTTASTINSAWGSITGTLSNQTDLQSALDGKLNLSGGTMSGSILFPNNTISIGSNTNPLGFLYGRSVFLKPIAPATKGWNIQVNQAGDNIKFESENAAGSDTYTVRYTLDSTGTPSINTDLITKSYADSNYGSGFVTLTGAQEIGGIKTFSDDIIVPDEVYGIGWNGSLEAPTKNAVYDQINSLGATYVNIAGTQTISGDKTFTGNFIIDDTIIMQKRANGVASATSGLLYFQTNETFNVAVGTSTNHIASFLGIASFTAARTFTLPNASGTIALTSNLPNNTNYVDLTTAQTINGSKTFNSKINAPQGVGFDNGAGTISVGALSSTLLSFGSNATGVFDAIFNFGSIATSNKTYTFPNKSGTFAMLDDITGGGTWGSITGTLSNQTDLQSALDGKASLTANQTFDGINTFENATTFQTRISVDAPSGSMPSNISSIDLKKAVSQTTYSPSAEFGSLWFNNDSDFMISRNITGQNTWNAALNFKALTALRNYAFPNESGTIALTSQIPTNGSYVDLTTVQSISGLKSFVTRTIFNGGITSGNDANFLGVDDGTLGRRWTYTKDITNSAFAFGYQAAEATNSSGSFPVIATINPVSPTNGTDLITKTYGDANYLGSSGTATNAGLLDGLDSLEFLQSVAAQYAGDLDSLSVNGKYRLTTGVTNFPSGAAIVGSQVVNYIWDANAAKQIFYEYNTDKIFQRRKVTTWQPWVELGAGGGVTDHGALTGLADNDHPQYVLKAGDTMTGDLNFSGANIIMDGTSTGLLNSADTGRMLLGGGSAWSTGTGAGSYISIEGGDYAGIDAGGQVTVNLANGRPFVVNGVSTFNANATVNGASLTLDNGTTYGQIEQKRSVSAVDYTAAMAVAGGTGHSVFLNFDGTTTKYYEVGGADPRYYDGAALQKIWHEGSPIITLSSSGNNSTDRILDFKIGTNDDQSVRLRHEISDGNLLQAGYAIKIESSGAIPQGKAHLEVEGNIFADGSKVWTAGNDGAGSGLDADLLDGRNSGDFVLNNDTRYTGDLDSLAGNSTTIRDLGSNANSPSGQSFGAILQINNSDVNSQLYFGRSNGGDLFYRGNNGSSLVGTAWNKVWTDGNDGAGSGLDADLLQGAAPSEAQSNSTIMKRTGSGYAYAVFFNGTGTFGTSGASSGMGNFTGTNGSDTFGRSYNATGASVYLATAKQFTESGDAVSTGDFNAISNTSMLTSINATANTPFGNAWYTFYQSRHRGGLSDGTSWASQIAIGMTSHQTRMAFRTESSNVWDTSWVEVITSAANNQNLTGDVYVVKDNAWLTLDSLSTGGNGTDQGAGISIGEAGYKGGASVHLTYTGDGYGHLGMGSVNATTNLPQYQVLEMFYLDNTARFKGAITAVGNITANSDRRLKTNVKPIENALEKIHQIDGCTWDRTDMELSQAGFIAQDMQKVLPVSVSKAEDEMGTLSVDQGNAMTALLLQAVKELTARVKQLEKQNK